ncbi:MAG: hypothetical protein ACP5N9_02485 [Candidatus Bilamarchaeum sp.]|jgi:tetratricopeptide (TPR) repeat protein
MADRQKLRAGITTGNAPDNSRIFAPGLPQTTRTPTAETAKNHHIRAMNLEEAGDMNNAALANLAAAASYSFVADGKKKEGDLNQARILYINSAASYHNQHRLETNETRRSIARSHAARKFELAAECASKITARTDITDYDRRSHWSIAEAEDLEKAAVDYETVGEGEKAKKCLLKAAVARINAGINLAYLGQDADASIRTAHKHFVMTGEKGLQLELERCDTWEKMIGFAAELDVELSVEEV